MKKTITDLLWTDKYLERKAEKRKVRLIHNFVPEGGTVLDFGCGNGLFEPFLQKKSDRLIGLEPDLELVEVCKKNNLYDELIVDFAPPIPLKDDELTTFFSSEVIEHMPTLEPIQSEFERVTNTRILLTMPNPHFKYFYDDPTHILKYTIASLRNDLEKSAKFTYKVRGLGFENIPGPGFVKRLTQIALWFFPRFSPTIAVIGYRRKD